MGKSLLPAENFVNYTDRLELQDSMLVHYILFLMKYLSCGCLSSTIEIAWETEMSSGRSSLTFPVCSYQKAINSILC